MSEDEWDGWVKQIEQARNDDSVTRFEIHSLLVGHGLSADQIERIVTLFNSMLERWCGILCRCFQEETKMTGPVCTEPAKLE